MNTQLVKYGIEEGKEDLRFHVGVTTKKVYVFEPKYVLEAIRTGRYETRFAYTGDIKTADGYLIPPEDINCRVFNIPEDIFIEMNFDTKDDTSTKGEKALLVVRKMLSRGLISPILDTLIVDDEQLQRDGVDIIPIFAELYQVKCDWKAGPRSLGGTGNLYIQTHECNPMKRY